ncbi:putative transporter svop-1 [Hippocampus zosterae]|uniref:putative transporter svop-1 n=1 Tax=Hippocampus zosterae TaxID=109293 RepID=UPI00223DA0F4|nr:putative transporter svop-1 [Hippocampus zosterae]
MEAKIDKGEDTEQALYSFDELLEDVGLGWYQARFYGCMCLLSFSEGSFLSVITMVNPILQRQYGISDFQLNTMIALIFLGFNLGSVCSGRVSDLYGRKTPFFLAANLANLVGYVGMAFTEFWPMTLCRVLQATLVGFFGPLAYTLLAEITPRTLRGRCMAICSATLSLGQLYGYLVGYVVLRNLEAGDWRLCLLLSNIPGTLALVMGYFYTDESARFLLLRGKGPEAYEIIEAMNRINGYPKFISVDSVHRSGLERWAASLQLAEFGLCRLFQADFALITALIWLNWGVVSFIYYGIVVNLPTAIVRLAQQRATLGEAGALASNHSTLFLMLTSVSEILAGVLVSAVVEVRCLGRKNTINWSLLLGACACVLVFLVPSQLVLLASLAKFFITVVLVLLYQYTAELYPTMLRSTGLGLANGLGRMSGVLMPVCYGLLAEQALLSPYLLFGGMALLCFGLNWLFPHDTTGADLDTLEAPKQE